MKSKLCVCPRYEKKVKYSYSLIKHINTYKISILLPSYQPPILVLILEHNITNHLDLPLDNFKENNSLKVSKTDEKKIRLADLNSDEEDIRSADIDKQKLATFN